MTWSAKGVKIESVDVSDRIALLPQHLKTIVEKAKSELGVKKVILFGSRGRGTPRENSDFDLAFEFQKKEAWPRFTSDIQDDPPSLYRYDLLDIDEQDRKFREVIEKEGVILYESGTSASH